MLATDINDVNYAISSGYMHDGAISAWGRIKDFIKEAQPQADNSAMDEIATVLSTCKGASISDQNMIDIAVIKLRQLRQ